MHTEWLQQLFGYEGRITDIYISRKQRKANSSPFAFVRFARKGEAMRAIQNLNGLEIRGCKISVSETKFKREFDREINQTQSAKLLNQWKTGPQSKDNWVDGRSFRDVVDRTKWKNDCSGGYQENQNPNTRTEGMNRRYMERKENEKEEPMKIVQGVINEDTLEWLQRSIVGEIIKPLNFNLLADRLYNEWLCISNVREMGAYKALVTFDSRESLEEALATAKDLLLNHFKEVRKWTDEELCQTRKVCLECYGIPPDAWNAEIIKNIGKVWGTVVYLDKLTEEGKSLSFARVLINRCVWQFIDGWIYLSDGGRGYDIYVKEIGREVYNVACFNNMNLASAEHHRNGNILASSEDRESKVDTKDSEGDDINEELVESENIIKEYAIFR